MQEVLVLIKPDGFFRGIAGDIIDQFAHSGLKVVGLKMVRPSRKLAGQHYALLKDKFFYGQILDYLTGQFHQGSCVVAMVLRGRNAIKVCRLIAGATNPEEADPRSVRGKYGRITTKGLFENVVHVSSDLSQARREIALWFKKKELIDT